MLLRMILFPTCFFAILNLLRLASEVMKTLKTFPMAPYYKEKVKVSIHKRSFNIYFIIYWSSFGFLLLIIKCGLLIITVLLYLSVIKIKKIVFKTRPINYTIFSAKDVWETVHDHITYDSIKKYASIYKRRELVYSWVVIASLKLELHFQPYYMK